MVLIAYALKGIMIMVSQFVKVNYNKNNFIYNASIFKINQKLILYFKHILFKECHETCV